MSEAIYLSTEPQPLTILSVQRASAIYCKLWTFLSGKVLNFEGLKNVETVTNGFSGWTTDQLVDGADQGQYYKTDFAVTQFTAKF